MVGIACQSFWSAELKGQGQVTENEQKLLERARSGNIEDMTIAERLHDRLRLFRRAGTLGGVESLVSIPARMSHRYLDEQERIRVGITPNMVRLSIGLESPADLLADLDAALKD